MTAIRNNITSLIKQPFVIAGILIVIAIAIVWANQASGPSSNESTSSSASAEDSFQLNPASTENAGQNVPSIMRNMNQAPAGDGTVAAPGLDRLVKGLEEKVAADPSNINNRMLLAQTYKELGMQDKALTTIRALQKEHPDNNHIKLIMSSILNLSDDQKNLKESLTILNKLSGDKSIQQFLVNLYKGDALIKIQDHAGALKFWKLALKDMPAGDNRRPILQQRIANLSMSGQDKKGSKGSNDSNESKVQGDNAKASESGKS